MPLIAQLGVLLIAFAGVTALALAFGAASIGIAATFGQIAFAVALVTLLLQA